MIAELALDAGLAVVVVLVAAWTIAARTAFAAVVGFVAYGLLLALVWVRLQAPDVALTEAAVGSGVTGLMLLSGVARLHPVAPVEAAERPGAALRCAAVLLCALVAAGLAALVLWPADPAPSLAVAAAAHLAGTGIGNAVTGVLMIYRAIDTLLECVVLLLALLGVWSLAPDRLWGGVPDAAPPGGADPALRLLARLLPPLGIVVGVHIFWAGSKGPGGEFQGAAILAAMWLLVMVAGLRAAPATGRRALRLVLVAGPATFLAVGFAGFVFADDFLGYPAGLVKPAILLIETPLTLSIAAMLALLALGPPARADGP